MLALLWIPPIGSAVKRLQKNRDKALKEEATTKAKGTAVKTSIRAYAGGTIESSLTKAT